MLNLKLDDWQKEILRAEGNILLCTGRQVGKTTIFSYKAIKRMLKERTKIIVVSLTEDQAQLIISMCLNFLEKLNRGMIKKGRDRPTKNRIRLKNGSEILSRPVGITGNSVRGFTADVLIVDEASRMPEDVWTASKPTLLTTDGDLWFCSTPYGRQGYFYECFNNRKRFKVFHISSEEVIKNRKISPAWTEAQRTAALEFLEQEKKDMSELRYAQEYLGQFVDDLRQYFPDDLIMRCMTETRPESISRNLDYYLGVDLARMGEDAITYEVFIRTNEDVLIQVENIVRKKQLTTQTEAQIIELDKKYNFKKIYVDAGAGSLGVSIFDHLLDNPQTKRKITAVNNIARVLDRDGRYRRRILKEDLYDNLRALMQSKRVRLLKDDEIFLSLKSVQYEIVEKPSKFTRVKIFGTDTHITEGVVRACWCIKEKNIKMWINSIKI